MPDNLINGSFTALQGLSIEPLHPQFGQILEQLLPLSGVVAAHEHVYTAHFSLIHGGFINSVLQKEYQANLPPNGLTSLFIKSSIRETN